MSKEKNEKEEYESEKDAQRRIIELGKKKRKKKED